MRVSGMITVDQVLVLGCLFFSRRASGLIVLVFQLHDDRDAVVRACVYEADERDVSWVGAGVDLLPLLLEISQERLERVQPPGRVWVLAVVAGVSPAEGAPPRRRSSQGQRPARGSGSDDSELVLIFFPVERATDE